MFIRATKTKNKETGQVYTTHRLVESIRTEKGPRQRIVMYLGEVTLEKSKWRALAKILEAKLSGQQELFEADESISVAADNAYEFYDQYKKLKADKQNRKEQQEIVPVDIATISHTDCRSLGPELVGHHAWQSMGFNEILKQCGLTAKQRALAEATVVGRLVAPGSDLSTWRWLSKQTALPELLSYSLGNVGKDSIYETTDLLLSHKEHLENSLYDKACKHFPSDQYIFLYDLTNTYFEGQCKNNDFAHRGKSKEKRSDCPLVTLALVVNQQGIIVNSHIYKGNQSEPETLNDVLERFEKSHPNQLPLFKPTLIMDRGIATKSNLLAIKEKGYDYVVIQRRAAEKDYIQEFKNIQSTFDCIDGRQESVFVKKLPVKEDETSCEVLCWSEGREAKEQAMDEKKEQHFIQDLTKLKQSIKKGYLKERKKIEQRVGKIKTRYSAIAQYYQINLVVNEKEKTATDITWEQKVTRKQRKTLTGCYVIETSHANKTAEEIWHLYMTLTQVESAFKSLKTDLGLRPVFHQLAHRTKAHLFISVLAYHLLSFVELSLREHGDHRHWGTLRSTLSTHQRSTIIFTDEQNDIHHIRISGTPETIHRDIYKNLGISVFQKRRHEKIGRRL